MPRKPHGDKLKLRLPSKPHKPMAVEIWRSGEIGHGDEANIHAVRAEVVGRNGKKREIRLVEKVFTHPDAEGRRHSVLHSYKMLKLLKKIGLKTIPVFLISRGENPRLFFTNLARPPRKVKDWDPKDEELQGLKNFEDLKEQRRKEEEIAEKNRVFLEEGSWVCSFNPITNKGELFVQDVTSSYIRREER